jgi:hypothetical protein
MHTYQKSSDPGCQDRSRHRQEYLPPRRPRQARGAIAMRINVSRSQLVRRLLNLYRAALSAWRPALAPIK